MSEQPKLSLAGLLRAAMQALVVRGGRLHDKTEPRKPRRRRAYPKPADSRASDGHSIAAYDAFTRARLRFDPEAVPVPRTPPKSTSIRA